MRILRSLATLAVLPVITLPQLVSPTNNSNYPTAQYIHSVAYPKTLKAEFPDTNQRYQDTVVKPREAEEARLEAERQAEAQKQAQLLYQPPKIAYSAPESPEIAQIKAIIIAAANEYGVNADQLLRVAACESGFNIYAHNPSGATGLFQFMSSTFYGNGGTNLYDAGDQARTAARMFAAGQSHQWVCQ